KEEWRDGNHFELLPGRERYIPALLSAIDEARESILFEQYLMESGRFADRVIDALTRASERGVAVYMLLDNYGAKGLEKSDRARLRRDGIA
ncbi:cardiolipin synthase B, partial [Pseudomonas sp. FW126-L8]|uniref:phospholipase D-like domain-containing protein n=1 Tax=Pseudomonas sp. FW126-L8 TaxID=2070635 RepID=UPI000CC08538